MCAEFGAGIKYTAIPVSQKSVVQITEYLFTVILDSFRDPEVIDFLVGPGRRVPRAFKIYYFPFEPNEIAFPVESPG